MGSEDNGFLWAWFQKQNQEGGGLAVLVGDFPVAGPMNAKKGDQILQIFQF